MSIEQAALATGLLYGGFALTMLFLMWDARGGIPTTNGTPLEVRLPLIFVAAAIVALTFLRFAVQQIDAGGVSMGVLAVEAAKPNTRVINAALLFGVGIMLRGWRKR